MHCFGEVELPDARPAMLVVNPQSMAALKSKYGRLVQAIQPGAAQASVSAANAVQWLGIQQRLEGSC